ncbi:MAG: SH3 domain-containing protein [Pseudomonas sp.]|uniref:SH3 domain-containing protein n=1 Tax=Pseudomonas sp. TaxID=306 RepID=UPI003395CE00
MNRTLLALALLVGAAPVFGLQAAEQSAITLQATALRETASANGNSLAQVEAQTRVTILQRQGGWYRVRTATGQQGWLTLLSVRFDKHVAAKSSDLGGLLSNSTEVAPAGEVATGVRGISDEELAEAANASPELQSMDRQAVSAGDAKAFARDGELSSQNIDYAP